MSPNAADVAAATTKPQELAMSLVADITPTPSRDQPDEPVRDGEGHVFVLWGGTRTPYIVDIFTSRPAAERAASRLAFETELERRRLYAF